MIGLQNRKMSAIILLSEPMLQIFHLDLHIFGCISQLGLPYQIPDWLAYIPAIYFCTVLGAASPRSRCQQGQFLVSVLGLQTVPSSLSPHMTFSLCVCIPLPLLIRTPVQSHQDSILLTSFNLNYLIKGPIPKYSYIGGQGFNMNFG